MIHNVLPMLSAFFPFTKKGAHTWRRKRFFLTHSK